MSTEEQVEQTEEKKNKKPKTLADLQKSLTKSFGKKAVILGDDIEEVPVLCSSGSYAVDAAIGIQGIPRGRILEYYGPPSGGKTLFTLLTIIECQKSGGVAAFLDLENSFDKNWFIRLGGDCSPEKFILLKPKSGADAYQMLEDMVTSNLVDIIGVDSVSTMTTDEENEGSYSDSHMAVLARLMSNGLKKFNSIMMQHPKTTIIFINQIRSGMSKYNPEIATGGSALAFYSSVRLNIRRIGGEDGILGPKDNPHGFRTKIRVEKNKVGPPKRIIETSVYVNHPTKIGVDKDEELLDIALSIGLIKRYSKTPDKTSFIEDLDGTYYEINNQKFYGWPKFQTYIEENAQVLQELKPTITAFMNKRVKPEPESFAAVVEAEEKKQRKSRKEKDNVED
jgi:recombination protein RecA